MKNQLFLKKPEKELILEILKLFGINGLDDNNYFTKKKLDELNTVDKIKEYKTKLSIYYIPCKSKLYLENITTSRTIVILRQLLRQYDYKLISKEKYIDKTKQLLYYISKIEPKKIILNFE